MINIKKTSDSSTVSFISNILKFSVASWVNFLIGIVAVSITTRIFAPDLYGVINIFNSASSFILSLVVLGLDSSFIRFYYEPPKEMDKRQLMAECMIIPAVLLVLGFIVIIIFFNEEFSLLLYGKNNSTLTIFLFIHIISNMALRFLNIIYRMEHNAKMYTLQTVLVYLFSKLFLVMAVIFTRSNIEIVILFNVLGIFLLALIFFFIQRQDILPKKIKFSMKNTRDLFSFGLGLWPVSMLNTGNIFLTGFIIIKQLGYFEYGIFTSASMFVGILSVFQSGFTTYWSSYMYENYKVEKARITKVHNYVLLFCVTFMIGFILFKDVVFLFIGKNYHAVKPISALMLVSPIFAIIGETTAYGINISKKTHYHLISSLTSILICLILSIILLPKIGLVGAAIASAVSGIALFFIRTYYGQKYYKSIESIIKTVIGSSLITILAILNYFFTNYYIILTMASIISILILLTIFKNDIDKIKLLKNLFLNKEKHNT